ncbi:MAG: signal peptidase II [Gammaproteobacteria bacterium]|nr:signal peptidase II [Gammaproteobacteria bacterium]
MRKFIIDNKVKILAVINILLVFIVDQISKGLILDNLLLHKELAVFKILTDKLNFGFNLFLTYNYGTSFSLIKIASGSTVFLLIATSVIISLILSYWLLKESSSNKFAVFALSLVIGGALGNIYDRLLLGYVIDFLDLYIGKYHWPVFNIADVAISVGAVILCFQLCFDKK